MNQLFVSYVGIVTGVIGAITGIAGAIMGFIAYRRSNEIKRSDRRLDLNKERNAAHLAVVGLVDLLAEALESRKNIMAARGAYRSGAMVKYQTAYGADSMRVRDLARQVPPADTDFSSMSLEQVGRKDRRAGSHLWLDTRVDAEVSRLARTG